MGTVGLKASMRYDHTVERSNEIMVTSIVEEPNTCLHL
jgi:hypothetical protein